MNISELHAQLEQEERFFKEWNDWSVVEPRIAATLQQILAYDAVLLEDGTGERSIAHRLAVYLEQEFPGWHVDCEFNRQGDPGDRATKRVSPSAPLLPESRPRQGTADVAPASSFTDAAAAGISWPLRSSRRRVAISGKTV